MAADHVILPPAIGSMIWVFERRGEFVRCETRKAGDGGFELVVTEPEGRDRVERFATARALARRQVELEQQLNAEGWNGPCGRL